jgi:histidine ammonia-lyase
VPEHSLGASGDLAPLAHCALVLLGEGWVLGPGGARTPGVEALADAGLTPITLAAKEGLALINGTDGMLGMLLLAVTDARHLFVMADVTAALAVEAMLGSDRPFLPELHTIRPHPGQAVSAANMFRLLQGSPLWTPIATTSGTRFRTRTRCAARRRWPGRLGTLWTSPPSSPAANWSPLWTTRLY